MKGITRITTYLSVIIILLILTTTILSRGTTLKNPIGDKTAVIMNEIEPYTTEYVYNSNIPSTADPVVLTPGVNGINYTYDGLNYIHISDSSPEKVEVGTGEDGLYVGKLTGYGPDCPGCSLVGNVSCKTYEGRNHSLINDGIMYNDRIFGSVRILAADNSKFPCGTIIKVNNGILNEFYGIVLDTGSSMRGAWANGNVWIDLAFSSQSVARTAGATSSNTKFSVQRWGW